MVRVLRNSLVIVIALAFNVSIAQKIEVGGKFHFTNDELKVNSEVLKSYEDSTHIVSLFQQKKPGHFGAYMKFYPKNNNLFFLSEVYSVRIRNDYTSASFSTAAYKIDRPTQPDLRGLSPVIILKKFNVSLLAGYEFPKAKSAKFMVLGGAHYFRTKFKIITAMDEISQSDLNIALKIQNNYLHLQKHNVGFIGGIGFRYKRFSATMLVTLDPSLKNTQLFDQKQSAVSGSVCYLIYNKNVTLSQYKEKQVSGSKINVASKAKLTFSVFTEARMYSKLSSFTYKDEFLFKQTYNGLDTAAIPGYLKITVNKAPKVKEMFFVGFAYQIKLPANLYFKNSFAIGRTEYSYGSALVLEGGYYTTGSGTPIEYHDASTASMFTKLGHTKIHFSIGYNNLKKNSFFAETGVLINNWNMRKSEIRYWKGSSEAEGTSTTLQTDKNDASSSTILEYASIQQKLGFNKNILGVSGTIGYKFNNVLLFVNYNQTLGNINTPNQYASIGKYSELKVCIAYQFAKFYFKKK